MWTNPKNAGEDLRRRINDEDIYPPFTIILATRPKALYWRDLVDRIIDYPVMIPGVKKELTLAFRIGGRQESRNFVKSIKDSDIAKITGTALLFSGIYPDTSKSQLNWLLKKLQRYGEMDSDVKWEMPPEIAEEEDVRVDLDSWVPLPAIKEPPPMMGKDTRRSAQRDETRRTE